MKHTHFIFIFLVIVVAISGCVTGNSTITPTWTQTKSSLPITIPASTTIPTFTPMPTFTFMPTTTLTATQTPLNTLEPEQAQDAIRTLLRAPEKCTAPCFWGITPEQTSLEEAKIIFAHLGLQLKHTRTVDNIEYYSLTYDDGGLSVIPILAIQNNFVMTIRVNIFPGNDRSGVPREWLAYSPETLVSQYGTPSQVDFFVGRGAPDLEYVMGLYFDAVDLIVQYGSYDVGAGATDSFHICPLVDEIDSVFIWLGKNPEYPPLIAVPLTEATELTLDNFAELMMVENPYNACVDLRMEMFP